MIIERGTSAELRTKLLGSPKFEIQFMKPIGKLKFPDLPGISELEYNHDRATYSCDNPEAVNPVLLRSLLEVGIDVVRLQEVPQSLERVYLEAVSNHGGGNG